MFKFKPLERIEHNLLINCTSSSYLPTYLSTVKLQNHVSAKNKISKKTEKGKSLLYFEKSLKIENEIRTSYEDGRPRGSAAPAEIPIL